MFQEATDVTDAIASWALNYTPDVTVSFTQRNVSISLRSLFDQEDASLSTARFFSYCARLADRQCTLTHQHCRVALRLAALLPCIRSLQLKHIRRLIASSICYICLPLLLKVSLTYLTFPLFSRAFFACRCAFDSSAYPRGCGAHNCFRAFENSSHVAKQYGIHVFPSDRSICIASSTWVTTPKVGANRKTDTGWFY